MAIFVDTSALFPLFVVEDISHFKATASWKELVASSDDLITTNYVVVETFALLQRRAGLKAALAFSETLAPTLNVQWIDADRHRRGTFLVAEENRRHLSLVDCTTFVVMRQLGIRKVFTFDRHFTEQGLDVIPD